MSIPSVSPKTIAAALPNGALLDHKSPYAPGAALFPCRLGADGRAIARQDARRRARTLADERTALNQSSTLIRRLKCHFEAPSPPNRAQQSCSPAPHAVSPSKTACSCICYRVKRGRRMIRFARRGQTAGRIRAFRRETARHPKAAGRFARVSDLGARPLLPCEGSNEPCTRFSISRDRAQASSPRTRSGPATRERSQVRFHLSAERLTGSVRTLEPRTASPAAR